ncbi:diguanylate cyclase [Paraglaciecola sp. 2405UD69-4]|uniref:diguanylate cyclase n=1 Tax=Paraglaciecola sp. 2405UD69-4 TaxID=3391836 RepID=UPI0039C8E132
MAKRYLISFIFILATGVCWGQDSNQALLDKAYEIRNQDREEYNRLLAVLELKDLTTLEQDFLTYLQARKALISGDDKKAIALAEQSARSNDVRISIISSQLLSNIYNLNFELEQAFNYIFYALALSKDYDDLEVVATVYAGAANLYAEIEDYNTATEFAEKTLATSNTPTQQCFIYATVGSGNRQINEEVLEKGIEACTQANQNLFIYLLYLNHAEYLLENEDPQLAYQFIKEHFEKIESSGFESYTYAARMLIGRSARRAGYLDEAEKELMQCLKSSEDDDSVQVSLRELGLIYLAREEFEKAANYFSRLDRVSTRVTDNKLKNQLAYQAAKFKSLDRQHQIGNLIRTNELNELRASLDDNKIKLLAISIVLITLLAIISTIIIYKQLVRFRQESFRDGLTNIGNRRWFDQHIKQLSTTHKINQIYCLVVFDLDNFKTINDKYGHAVGDVVLKRVCDVVKNQIRNSDPFARIGGEEFALILENATEDDVITRIEKCRTAIENIQFKGEISELKISASFGICFNFQADNNVDIMFKLADEAMYQSKQNGRNQVTIYDPTISALKP